MGGRRGIGGMNKEIRFYELRELYLENENTHPRLFDKFWEFFDASSHWVYNKYIRILSDLEIRADFCVAIDGVIREVPLGADLGCLRDKFSKFFSAVVRQDREEKLGFRESLKKQLVKRRRFRSSDVPEGKLNNIRIMFGLPALRIYEPIGCFNKIETLISDYDFQCGKKELEELVVGEFGEDRWEDWKSNVIHREPLQKIANFRNYSLNKIWRQLSEVNDVISENFSECHNSKK